MQWRKWTGELTFKRVRAWVMDVVVVLAALAFGPDVLDAPAGAGTFDRVSIVVLTVGTVMLLWRRSIPEIVYVVALLASVLYYLSVRGDEPVTPEFVLPIGGYALAAYGRRRYTWGLLLVAVAVSTFTMASVLAAFPENNAVIQGLIASIVWVGVPWLLGNTVRGRRRYVTAVEERAARLEAERELRAVRAVVEERARIARELHDVVAHHVSVMGVQAGAARLSLRHDLDRAEKLLGSIESTGRQAVQEMRHMLGVLRTPAVDDTSTTLDDAVRPDAPQPGLAELPALVTHFRDAGLPVKMTVDERGASDTPPTDILQLSLYRIVEQSLTNVLEHAGPVPTFGYLRIDDDAVELTVQNDPPAQPKAPNGSRAPSRGHGTVGMRERVALFAGIVDSGPLPDGGYRVRVRLSRRPA